MTSLEGYYNPIIIEESTPKHRNNDNNYQNDNKNQNSDNVNENPNGQTITNEERPPIIYIDMPNSVDKRENIQLVTQKQNGCSKIENQSDHRAIDEERPPVIYIDIPNSENRREYPHLVTNRHYDSPKLDGRQTTISTEAANQHAKQNTTNQDEFSPDITINQPNWTQNTPQIIQNEPPTPNHVEQTIFYDPFEDRRIVLSSRTDQNSPRPVRVAPLPPRHQQNHEMNFQEQDQNRNHLEERHANSSRPTELTKTSSELNRSPNPVEHSRVAPEYQRTQRPTDLARALQEFHTRSPDFNAHRPSQHRIARLNLTAHSPLSPDDGFILTPLPVTEYLEPPPPYQEVILETRQGSNGSNFNYNSNVVTQQPSSGFGTDAVSTQNLHAPERNDQQPSVSPSRKILKCQHCNTRVATVVIKQNGCATHVIAILFLLFCLFPITILIYCGGCLKYENHYCPTCSNMIGYRVPLLGQQLVHVSP